MSEDFQIPYMRAKQSVRSRTVAGVLATTLSMAVGTIAYLVREGRSDAEKAELTLNTAQLTAQIASLQSDIRMMSEKLTGVSERLGKAETKIDVLMTERPARPMR